MKTRDAQRRVNDGRDLTRSPLPSLSRLSWRPCLLSLILCLLLLFSGCATSEPETSLVAPDFRVRGKIAVRDGSTGFAATFDWLQADERYEITLRGPLGQGHARLVGDGRHVSVTSPDGVVHEGEDAQALFENVLGWSMPVAALRHWVRGRYDPLAPAAQERHDENGNLTAFHQHGWTVRLGRWQRHYGGASGTNRVVPGRIVASREERRITVVCKEWWFD